MAYFLEFILFPAFTAVVSILYVQSLILAARKGSAFHTFYAVMSGVVAGSALLSGGFLAIVAGISGIVFSLPAIVLGAWIAVALGFYLRAPEQKRSVILTAVPSLIWCALLIFAGAMMVMLSFAIRHM